MSHDTAVAIAEAIDLLVGNFSKCKFSPEKEAFWRTSLSEFAPDVIRYAAAKCCETHKYPEGPMLADMRKRCEARQAVYDEEEALRQHVDACYAQAAALKHERDQERRRELAASKDALALAGRVIDGRTVASGGLSPIVEKRDAEPAITPDDEQLARVREQIEAAKSETQ